MKLKHLLTGFIMLFALFFCAFSSSLFSQNIWNGTSSDISWYTGNETNSEYEISTPAQLAGIAQLVNAGTTDFNGKTIKLTSDIWLNADNSRANNWIPIGGSPTATVEFTGTNPKYFKGNFNGQNHIIYNMSVDKTGYYQAGLFGSIMGSITVENLALINPYVKARGMCGALVGFIGSSSNVYIKNCIIINAEVESHSIPTSTNANNVGGIIGATYTNSLTTYIQNCAVTGSVSGYYPGGIAGNGERTNIRDTYFAGTINRTGGDANYGGITAWSGTLTNCYSNVTPQGGGNSGTVKTSTEMRAETFITGLNVNDEYFKVDCNINDGFPILEWMICDFPITGPTEICSGTNATLTALGFDSYIWSTGATSASISVSPALTTTYYVTTTRISDSFSITGEITVNVSENITISGAVAPSYDGLLHGTITPDSIQVSCTSDDEIPYTITPDEGWYISKIIINGNVVRESDPNDVYPLQGSFDHGNVSSEIVVHFNNLYAVTASMELSGGGDLNIPYLISPWGDDGVASAVAGSDFTYTFNETGRYHISDVKIDGVSQGRITSYTFENINRDGHTVEVTYYEQCGIIELPYIERFDAYGTGLTVYADCWQRNSTAGNNPYINTTHSSSPGALYFNSTSTTYAMGILPALPDEINVSTLQASFKLYKTSANYNIMVGLMSDPLEESSFQLIRTVSPGNINSWEVFDVTFDSYTGTGKYIVFRSDRRDASSSNIIYMDDLEINTVATCIRPYDVSCSAATGSSVTLSWSGNNPAGEWEVAYVPVGEEPVSGVQASINSGYVLEGLSPVTSYDIYVRSICDENDISGWSNPITVNTTQILGHIPYICDFEEENNNWEFKNGTQTNKWNLGTAVNNGGTKSLYISNNQGTSHTYSTGSTSSVYAFRTIYFDEQDEYAVKFDWIGYGEMNTYGYYYDFLRAFLVPDNITFTAGNTSGISGNSTPTGWISLDNGQALVHNPAWVTLTDTVSITNPGNYNLVFYWRNDGSGGTQPPAAIDNISIRKVVTESPIAEVDYYNDIFDEYNTCMGTTESDVINLLTGEITITDEEGREYRVPLTWTIADYSSNTAGTYIATGTFALPSNVIQTDPVTPTYVSTDVIVNNLPQIVTCPGSALVSVNETLELSGRGENPAGGEFSGTNVSANIFNPSGLSMGNYTLTYTITDPATGCTNSCNFTVSVTYPQIDDIDVDNEVANITVCTGTPASEVVERLTSTIVISDTDDVRHTINVNWELESGYDPQNIGGTYSISGTFDLPETVSQTAPPTPLIVTASATIISLPVINVCPSNTSVSVNNTFTLSGRGESPAGGQFSGTNVNGEIFNPSGLVNGDYILTYTITDAVTSCLNSCNFTVTVTYPEINLIDADSQVANINVCAGTQASDALDNLTSSIVITDMDNVRHPVNLTWTIDPLYDPDNTGTTYVATGTFELPERVVQQASPIDLQVTANVTIIALPVVNCPDGVVSTTVNNTLTLSGATPEGGTYSGANVNGRIFNPSGLSVGDYNVIYTYTDQLTTCSNSCTFNVMVTYPTLSVIDANNQVPESLNSCIRITEEDVISDLLTQILTDLTTL